MPRQKKYVCEDGTYLDIDDRGDVLYISWYFPRDGMFGAYVGEVQIKEVTTDPKEDLEGWEYQTATVAVAPLADGRDLTGYYFETEAKAKKAMAAANQVLLSGVPWPEWAIKAQEAGWKPPKGWKPGTGKKGT